MKSKKPGIIIVDDDRDLLETLKTILKKNYTPILFTSGKEALKRIIENNIDVVILDINMKEINGIDLLKEIKSLDNNLDVIMLTALKDVSLAVQAMKLGALDYINKPFEVDELLSVIEKALERRALVRENIYLRSVVEEFQKGSIIGQSPSVKKIFEIIDKIAPTTSTVLITGESGTGKELVAQSIHKKSSRANNPFVVVNCAAIPENLLESELFGHEKGSFTGAFEKRAGKFELASEGTIFLDEIGCMPQSMQSKLLRVLQEGEIERVGGSRPIEVNVRVIAATNLDLAKEVKEGKFREDLYYRLNVIPVKLPPLRERAEDVAVLAEYFLRKYNQQLNKQIKGLTRPALEVLEKYNWPGNVRELENFIERLVALSDKEYLDIEDLPLEILGANIAEDPKFRGSFKEACLQFEKQYIKRVLDQAGGNQTRAAQLLGLHRTTFISRLDALGMNKL